MGEEQRIRGIEGARAWLAWTVVASHILAAVGPGFPGVLTLGAAADQAVLVFIVVCGFVITHLILTDCEPYPLFIARRLLRIYPVYLVCLALGIWTAFTFGAAAPAPGTFVPQLLAHLLLLHGAIPGEWLQKSPSVFLSPAWTLSVEWQFYLVAPLVLVLLRRPAGRFAMLFLVGLGMIACQRHLLGAFYLPSILPGAGAEFALGIATRLALDRLPRFDSMPAAVVGPALALIVLLPHLAYLGIWVVLVAYIRLRPEALAAPRLTARVARVLLDGSWVRAGGRRSYAVYLLHAPVVAFATPIVARIPHLARSTELLALGAIAIALTAVGSELLHRFVEQPAIAFGRRLGRRPVPAATRIASPQPAE